MRQYETRIVRDVDARAIRVFLLSCLWAILMFIFMRIISLWHSRDKYRSAHLA